jgi:hypothetical protein
VLVIYEVISFRRSQSLAALPVPEP